jgi:glycosyltransferase involved in cell wall biosynthesis
MDDWPSVISSKGLFRNLWKAKIDDEFRQLLKKVDLHFCICDAMAEEYQVRYGLNFIPFHNPVETNIWLNQTKSNFEINNNNISMLYAGRIGTGIKKSIIEIATALDEMIKKGNNIILNIQAPNIDNDFKSKIEKFKCTKINPIISYDKIPEILSSSDILLFANDFSRKGIAFLKFSMPTKASEYMISGTPIFVYAPKESAASKLFFENDCGFCVFTQSKDAIIKGIEYLIKNLNYRKKISSNAVHLAKEKFDAEVVRMKFHHELINIAKC